MKSTKLTRRQFIPKPPVHFPETGWLTRIDVAVIEVGGVFDVVDVELDEVLDEPLGGVEKADTHEPTVALDSEPVTVWLKVVDVVYVTAVWPLVPWTSRVWPLMAATVPVAPGSVLGGVEDPLVVVVVPAEEAAPPQAARASTHAPRAAPVAIRRR